MKQIIEFKQTTHDSIPRANPWATPAKDAYKDLIIKPEFASRRFKFPLGPTWLRIVPAHKDSTKEPYLGVHALQYKGGRHCHARTVSPDGRSVFDRAYRWFLQNNKNALFSKVNKQGYRFLSDPLILLWFVTDLGDKRVAQLLLASGYDGSRGGSPGLGQQIWALTNEVDEDGTLLGDPAHPERGVQVCITKKQVAGAKYASYHLSRGRIPSPMKDMYADMDEAEHNAIKPLEDVIHIPTEEEEWTLLENILDPETVCRIRDSEG